MQPHSIKMKFKIVTILCVAMASSLFVIALHYGKIKSLDNHEVNNTISGFFSLHRIDLVKHMNTSNYGYVLASYYSDQVTAAAPNVVSLQCWAATISHQLRVVEPFLIDGSKLGFAIATSNNDKEEKLLTLRDLLNIDKLEKFVREKNYSPLSTWNSFLEDAPRNLILVCACTFPERVTCEDQNKTFYQDAMTFAENNGFQVVRYVYEVKYTYKATEFRKLVYGQFSPNTSVVLFNAWGGIQYTVPPVKYRIGISKMDYCSRGKFIQSIISLHSSELIHQDAQRYMKQYLHKKYISVMFRTEHFTLRHRFGKLDSKKQMLLLTKCVNSISDFVHKMKKKYAIESVFLAMDCRKQGSYGYRITNGKLTEKTQTIVSNVSALLYRKLYRNSSSLEDWDDSFDNISSYKAPGYIAQLQKELAASGTCLLTAGGGTFQDSAKALHHHMHTTHCVHDIPNC